MIRITLLGTAALFAVAAAPLAAQTATPVAAAAEDSLEIVVTAQKRSERLQDVPVAVSVISGATLERNGGINIESAQYLVPSLNFRKSGTALNQSLYIRGIGTTTFSIGGEPSVSTVLDGVVLSRSGEAFSDLVDIERIEVLRGPQGTLFGKNTSAGVVNIVSKRPGDDFGGFVEGGFFFDNGNEYRVRGGVDIPLGDNVKSRFTGFYSKYDGNSFNDTATVNRRVNGYERYGVRGIVEAQASDTVKLTLIGDWRKSNDDCCAEVIGAPALNPDGSVFAAFTTRAAAALPPVLGDKSRTVRQNLLTQALEKAWGVSLQADVELGNMTVTSITAYRGYDSNEIRDGDFLDRPYVGIAQSHDTGPQTATTFTQELRLTSPSDQALSYVVGAYYSRAVSERTFTRSNIRCTASTLPVNSGGLTPCSTAPGVSTIDFPVGTAVFGSTFQNVALFGQATYNISESFRLIGGLRYTLDQVDGFLSRSTPVPGASNAAFDEGVFNSISPAFPNGNPAAANGQPFRQRATATNLSGKVGAQFDISNDIMAYGTYARGYKGPGLNIFFNLNANGTPPLAPETSDSYEIGLKNTLFDGSLILNLAGFYAKYKNFQANNPDFVLGQRVTRFSNAGTISTRGFEADLLFRPMKDLNFSGGLAYTDAKIDAFLLPPGADATQRVPNGTQLPYAPKWKGSLGGDYTIRTGGFADINFGIQTSYQSKQLTLLVPNALAREQGTVKAYGLVDLNVALVGKDDLFRITFVVKNLFDTSFAAAISDGGPLSAGVPAGGTSSYRFLIPREADRYFGLTGRFNF